MAQKKNRQTKYDSYKQLVAKGSACSTKIVSTGEYNPEWIHIRFKGPLANVPAIKNQRFKGTNILRHEIRAHLEVMSEVFKASVDGEIPKYSAKTMVFCFLHLAYRAHAYDDDNCVSTVKDWLEPRYIRQKDRKWGVGIVKNDMYVNAFSLKKGRDDPDSHITDIYLMPAERIADIRSLFINGVISEPTLEDL